MSLPGLRRVFCCMSQFAFETYRNYLDRVRPAFRHRLDKAGMLISTLPVTETIPLKKDDLAEVDETERGLQVTCKNGQNFLFTPLAQEQSDYAETLDMGGVRADSEEALTSLLLKYKLSPEQALGLVHQLHGPLMTLVSTLIDTQGYYLNRFFTDLVEYLLSELDRPEGLPIPSFEQALRRALNPAAEYDFTVLSITGEHETTVDTAEAIDTALSSLLSAILHDMDRNPTVVAAQRPKRVSDLAVTFPKGEYTARGDDLLLYVDIGAVRYAISSTEIA